MNKVKEFFSVFRNQLVIFDHCVLFRINMMLRKQQARIKKFMKKGEDDDEQFEKKNHN